VFIAILLRLISEYTLKKLVLETNTRSCVGSGQHKFVLYWVRQTQVCVSKLAFGISTQACVNLYCTKWAYSIAVFMVLQS